MFASKGNDMVLGMWLFSMDCGSCMCNTIYDSFYEVSMHHQTINVLAGVNYSLTCGNSGDPLNSANNASSGIAFFISMYI